MDGRWIDSELHVVRSHLITLRTFLNPDTHGSFLAYRPHDHIHVQTSRMSRFAFPSTLTLSTLLGVPHTPRNRQMSNVVQLITRDSAPEYSFRDPIAIPLFVITQAFTLLNFPVMWLQIVQAAKKLKSAVRFLHT